MDAEAGVGAVVGAAVSARDLLSRTNHIGVGRIFWVRCAWASSLIYAISTLKIVNSRTRPVRPATFMYYSTVATVLLCTAVRTKTELEK